MTTTTPIKLVIFDLDGVLIDSKDVHYEALNDALATVDSAYVIDKDEHFRLFDGLTTKQKLAILTEKKGLDPRKYKQIWQYKQQQTARILEDTLQRDEELCGYFTQLHNLGYKIAIASNSIRATIELILSRLGLLELVDYHAGNEDILRKKPHPEIYWKCMANLNAIPEYTVILEDSHLGQQGALHSKCHLIPVTNRNAIHQSTIDLIKNILDKKSRASHPWTSNTLNVLIPMAGLGSRFIDQGYTFPKPLIMVKDKSMIQVVVDNLNIKANFIFIVQEKHYAQYHLDRFLPLIMPGCKIVQSSPTEGAACTTLLAKNLINTDDALLIANSDQFIQWDSSETMYAFTNDSSDGSIITFNSIHPKWSYAKLGEDGYVAEVAEKLPISAHATAGIYFWKRGADYVKYAEQMIAKNKRVNNEFYVCPIFNEAIEAGLKIRIKELDKASMWSLGTPEDLTRFLDQYQGEV